MPSDSNTLVFAFVGLLAVTVAAALVAVGISGRDRPGSIGRVRAGVGLVIWMAIAGVAARSGWTARWDLVPPPLLVLVLGGFVATFVVAGGRLGQQIARLPIAGLILFQGFRFPLEPILHLAYEEGVMPVQMSFAGRNFDIVTGILGLTIGGYFLAKRRDVPTWMAWTFNIVGIVLLLNILGIAVASMPMFTMFGPDHVNRWIAHFPYIWLPTVFVTLAVFGHVALTRRLRASRPTP